MPTANHLIHETSPYLLQHAHNPVEWYPWGEAALQKARNEDKPILLSVGYAACHWCHVMEHESFEDADTAALMNEHFVNIKVDREERPDIDTLYMSAVVAMTQHGGWPMTVFLLPDGTPFYGGTYFPPDDKAARYGVPSFKRVLVSVAEAYHTRREQLVQEASQLLAHLQQQTSRSFAEGDLNSNTLDTALAALWQQFDRQEGGFGGAPKFPQPMILEFLLRAHLRSGNDDIRAMADHTLYKMALGGIYDQLGGGFHRYSVDAHWLVPHFEKMLYDNALLARVYTEAFQLLGNPFYQRIAQETLDYLVREMLHEQGGFFSTQDADSLPLQAAGVTHAGQEKEEGAFFVWTPEQIREILGEDTLLFCQIFDVTSAGNFEGRNILHLPRPLEEVARVTGTTREHLTEVAARGRKLLWGIREQRPRPERDEKVLVAWNGMALRAFATAAAAFGRPDYLQVAQRNADFLLANLRREDGRLLRSWKDGRAQVMGYLEDYALLADGLLALYSVDGDPRWLREALTLADTIIALFWDEETSGFFDTASDHEQLVTRPREVSDNATPAGNSVAIDVLLRLAALTGNERYRSHAERALGNLTAMLRRVPVGFGRLLCAADFALAPVREVALVGDMTADDTCALLNTLYKTYRPYIVVAFKPVDADGQALDFIDLPLLANREQIDGKATAYVCQGFTCQLPVTEAEALQAQLEA
jgi:hypothetical protein